MRRKYICIGLLMNLIACNFLMAQQESVTNIYAGMPLGVISSNGEWIGGTYQGATYVYHTVTDELTFLTEMNGLGSGIGAISPEGLIVGALGTKTSSPAAICRAGEWTILPYPEDYRTLGGGVRGVTDDETLLAGYIIGVPYEGVMNLPCIWKLEDGMYKFQILPAPQKDIQGQLPQGSIVKDISRDGSVLLGEFTDCSGFHKQPILWMKEGDTYSYKLMGTDIIFNVEEENPGIYPAYEKYVTAERGTPEYNEQFKKWSSLYSEYNIKMGKFETGKRIDTGTLKLSGNGRWFVTTLLEALSAGDSPDPSVRYASYAYRFDLSEGTETAYRFSPFLETKGTAVMDDGTLWVAIPYNDFTQSALICPDKTVYTPVYEWIKEQTGIDVSDDLTFSLTFNDPETTEPIKIDSILTGYPILSKDGSVLAGTLWDPAGKRGYINYYLYTSIPDAVKCKPLTKDHRLTIRNKYLYFPEEAQSIAIMGLTGKTVYEDRGTGRYQIDVSELPEGIYLVKWIENARIKVEKVIIK